MNRAPNPCNSSLSQSLCPHLEILANSHYLVTKAISDRDPQCAEDVTRFMEWSDQALNAMVRLIWEDLESSEADGKDPEQALGFKWEHVRNVKESWRKNARKVRYHRYPNSRLKERQSRMYLGSVTNAPNVTTWRSVSLYQGSDSLRRTPLNPSGKRGRVIFCVSTNCRRGTRQQGNSFPSATETGENILFFMACSRSSHGSCTLNLSFVPDARRTELSVWGQPREGLISRIERGQLRFVIGQSHDFGPCSDTCLIVVPQANVLGTLHRDPHEGMGCAREPAGLRLPALHFHSAKQSRNFLMPFQTAMSQFPCSKVGLTIWRCTGHKAKTADGLNRFIRIDAIEELGERHTPLIHDRYLDASNYTNVWWSNHKKRNPPHCANPHPRWSMTGRRFCRFPSRNTLCISVTYNIGCTTVRAIQPSCFDLQLFIVQ